MEISDPWVHNIVANQAAPEKWLLADKHDAQSRATSEAFLKSCQNSPDRSCAAVRHLEYACLC